MHFEYAVVGVIVAIVSCVTTSLILGEVWLDQISFLLLFSGWNCWCGYRLPK
jgi:hypothetical protein